MPRDTTSQHFMKHGRGKPVVTRGIYRSAISRGAPASRIRSRVSELSSDRAVLPRRIGRAILLLSPRTAGCLKRRPARAKQRRTLKQMHPSRILASPAPTVGWRRCRQWRTIASSSSRPRAGHLRATVFAGRAFQFDWTKLRNLADEAPSSYGAYPSVAQLASVARHPCNHSMLRCPLARFPRLCACRAGIYVHQDGGDVGRARSGGQPPLPAMPPLCLRAGVLQPARCGGTCREER